MFKKIVRRGLILLFILTLLSGAGFAESKSKKNKEFTASVNKTIYLTFDDGPSVENTEDILDVLNAADVKATFFITGAGKDNPISQSEWERIVARIDSEGHVIGNHTFDHEYSKVYSSARAFMKSVNKLDEAVYQVTGKHTRLFRFPGGSNNGYIQKHTGYRYAERVLAVSLKDKKYRYFDWNVSSADAAAVTNDTSVIVFYVKKGVKENDRCIVLHHDSKFKTTTVEALKEELQWMKEQGYRFDTLDHATGSYLFRTQWKAE